MDDVNKTTVGNAAGGAGRGLFTSQSIEGGELIIRVQDPLVIMPHENSISRTCSWCMLREVREIERKPGACREDGFGVRGVAAVRFCTGCQVLRFCSKTCQTNAWKAYHKRECKILNRMREDLSCIELSWMLRMGLRLLVIRAMDKEAGLPDARWKSFMGLVDHTESFKSRCARGEWEVSVWDKIKTTTRDLLQFGKFNESPEVIWTLFARIKINSFAVHTAWFETVGVCLDPVPVLINHSCDPNAIMVWEGRCCSIRSMSRIPKGSEITSSYITTSRSLNQRRQELEARYFFDCACPECSVGTTLGLPDPPESLLKAFPTPRALFQFEHEGKIDERIVNQAANLKAAGNVIRFVLAKTRPYKAVLPPYREPWVALRLLYPQCCFAEGRNVQALATSFSVYLDIIPRLFPCSWHPSRFIITLPMIDVLESFTRADAAHGTELEKYDLDYAIVMEYLIVEVLETVDKAYGGESRFARMTKRAMKDMRKKLRERSQGTMGPGKHATVVSPKAWEMQKQKMRKIADDFQED